MKKYHWLIATIIILAGLGSVYWQRRCAAKILDEVMAARNHRVTLASRLKLAQTSLTKASVDTGRLKASVNGIRSKETAEADLDLQKRQQAFARAGHAWMNLHYAALFRKLGLSVEQIDKMEGLHADYLEQIEDIKSAAKANSIPLSDPAVGAMIKDAAQQLWRDGTTLLGPGVMEADQEYERAAKVRSVTSTVAGDVYYTDTPLTAEQGDQLTQILANNSTGYQNGQYASPQDLNVQNALAQAQKILSPAQLAALKSSLQGMAASATLYSRIATLTDGTPTASASPEK